MSTMSNQDTSPALTRRLLQDIAEIRKDPYPNVHLYFDDYNITQACLILTPENNADPLHLTIHFHKDYPLRAPSVQMQSGLLHPNVFNNHVCASMLNTDEGWTAAYTLKGIVIQLLSFFTSDRLEQQYGGYVDLNPIRKQQRYGLCRMRPQYVCRKCNFGTFLAPQRLSVLATSSQKGVGMNAHGGGDPTQVGANGGEPSKLLELPDELWLMIFPEMDTADIFNLSDAIPSVKAMVNSYDFIRTRELQCFCLKTSFLETKLGIGVSVGGGKRGTFKSEFDLISNEAFGIYGVRKSIQGVYFDKWLPVPLSHRHWNQVRLNTSHCLAGLHRAANLEGSSEIDVIYNFMNSIVIQFSNDSERIYNREDERSTLNHASEKAVESYFTLFHLLLCLATEKPSIIHSANQMVSRFLGGQRSKSHFPDIGVLLVATLISDTGMTEDFTYALIREVIVRNVVWMLDIVKGRGMPELAYLEPSNISDYRLAKTFEASRTSYRLLMFFKLFSSTARKPGKTLIQLRDELFDTHGAPPSGTSARMAQQIRNIHTIDNFFDFLSAMGIRDMPPKSGFSMYLKRTIKLSEDAGYSVMPLSQSQAFLLRREKEHGVLASDEVHVNWLVQSWWDRGRVLQTFFPGRDGGFGGRDRGRGRGRGGGWRGRGGR